MGIHTSSKLFVGAQRRHINCEDWILDNELPEGMSEEEANDIPYIERISPYYDANDSDCYYGIEVSCNEIRRPGGLEKVDQLVAQLNELFKTSACTLMHSAHVS